MLNILWHYAHALERRFFLAAELKRIRAAGKTVPVSLSRLVWRSPASAEDWVNLLCFLDPTRSATLLDVGANVGEFAVEFLKVFPNSRVFCVEPTQKPFESLLQRLSSDQRVTSFNCGASDCLGTATITIAGDHRFSSLTAYSDDGLTGRGFSESGQELVQLRRLDELELGPASEQFVLKVDVQGHEVAAFRGANGILDKVDVVLAELSFAQQFVAQDPSFSAVCTILAEHGLFPVIFQDHGYIGSTYAYEGDVIFVRRDQINRIWHKNYRVIQS